MPPPGWFEAAASVPACHRRGQPWSRAHAGGLGDVSRKAGPARKSVRPKALRLTRSRASVYCGLGPEPDVQGQPSHPTPPAASARLSLITGLSRRTPNVAPTAAPAGAAFRWPLERASLGVANARPTSLTPHLANLAWRAGKERSWRATAASTVSPRRSTTDLQRALGLWGGGWSLRLRMRALVLRAGSRDDPLGISAPARPGRDRHRTRTRPGDLAVEVDTVRGGNIGNQ
jgi:hypothetical protein